MSNNVRGDILVPGNVNGSEILPAVPVQRRNNRARVAPRNNNVGELPHDLLGMAPPRRNRMANMMAARQAQGLPAPAPFVPQPNLAERLAARQAQGLPAPVPFVPRLGFADMAAARQARGLPPLASFHPTGGKRRSLKRRKTSKRSRRHRH